jgi:hypothetical protein
MGKTGFENGRGGGVASRKRRGGQECPISCNLMSGFYQFAAVSRQAGQLKMPPAGIIRSHSSFSFSRQSSRFSRNPHSIKIRRRAMELMLRGSQGLILRQAVHYLCVLPCGRGLKRCRIPPGKSPPNHHLDSSK